MGDVLLDVELAEHTKYLHIFIYQDMHKNSPLFDTGMVDKHPLTNVWWMNLDDLGTWHLNIFTGQMSIIRQQISNSFRPSVSSESAVTLISTARPVYHPLLSQCEECKVCEEYAVYL